MTDLQPNPEGTRCWGTSWGSTSCVPPYTVQADLSPHCKGTTGNHTWFLPDCGRKTLPVRQQTEDTPGFSQTADGKCHLRISKQRMSQPSSHHITASLPASADELRVGTKALQLAAHRGSHGVVHPEGLRVRKQGPRQLRCRSKQGFQGTQTLVSSHT